jgi:hypothetical protein
MDFVGNLVGIVLGIAIVVGVSFVILLLLTVLILMLLKRVRKLADDVRYGSSRVSTLAKQVERSTGGVPAQQAEYGVRRPSEVPPEPDVPPAGATASAFATPPPPPPAPPWPGPMAKKGDTDPVGIPVQHAEPAPVAQPRRRGRHAGGGRHSNGEDE